MYTLIAVSVVALILLALIALIEHHRIAKRALAIRVAQRQRAQKAERARAMSPWSQALDWDGNPL